MHLKSESDPPLAFGLGKDSHHLTLNPTKVYHIERRKSRQIEKIEAKKPMLQLILQQIFFRLPSVWFPNWVTVRLERNALGACLRKTWTLILIIPTNQNILENNIYKKEVRVGPREREFSLLVLLEKYRRKEKKGKPIDHHHNKTKICNLHLSILLIKLKFTKRRLLELRSGGFEPQRHKEKEPALLLLIGDES